MKEKVFESGGLVRGSSAAVLQTFLLRQPGTHRAEANYMSDTVTVGYDEAAISHSRQSPATACRLWWTGAPCWQATVS